MWAIEAEGLVKVYRKSWWQREEQRVLQEVSLRVRPGSIFGILGPNGAGKTTLISILATLLRPEAGRATVLGLDVLRQAAALRPRLNLVSGATKFIWSLTVEDNLRFYGRLYGLYGRLLAARVAEVVELFELDPWRRQTFENLSTGIKQRLALAKAFLTRPELLFLDEPTLGLDPLAAAHTRQEIQRLNQAAGLTIILTTHNMREAESLCQEVAFLRQGRVVAQGRLPELQRQLALGDRLFFAFANSLPELAWSSFPGLLACRPQGKALELVVDNAEIRLPAVMAALLARWVVVERLKVQPVDLEELYREMAL